MNLLQDLVDADLVIPVLPRFIIFIIPLMPYSVASDKALSAVEAIPNLIPEGQRRAMSGNGQWKFASMLRSPHAAEYSGLAFCHTDRQNGSYAPPTQMHTDVQALPET
jgi:hypothetical protein